MKQNKKLGYAVFISDKLYNQAEKIIYGEGLTFSRAVSVFFSTVEGLDWLPLKIFKLQQDEKKTGGGKRHFVNCGYSDSNVAKKSLENVSADYGLTVQDLVRLLMLNIVRRGSFVELLSDIVDIKNN